MNTPETLPMAAAPPMPWGSDCTSCPEEERATAVKGPWAEGLGELTTGGMGDDTAWGSDLDLILSITACTHKVLVMRTTGGVCSMMGAGDADECEGRPTLMTAEEGRRS